MSRKIFVLSYCFPNRANAQLGRFVLEQSEEMRKRGADITILNVAPLKENPFKKMYLREENGFPVYESTVYPIALSKFPALTTKIFLEKYKKLFKKAIEERGKPDVIYAHFCFPTGFVAKEIAKELDIPFVIMEYHSYLFRQNLPKFIKEQLTDTVDKCRAFMCVAGPLKRRVCELTSCAPDKLSVVHAIVEDRFTYTEPPKNDRFVFFGAGNLVHGKRFGILVDAANVLNKKGVDFEVRIAGMGDEWEMLKSKISEYGLEDKVFLLGRKNKEEMLEQYKKCNAFVLLSLVETYGIVYREAMLVGRPVISSKNDGVQEDWQDSFGKIMEETTPENLAVEMQNMMENYHSYDFKAISDATAEVCSAEKICEKVFSAMQI